MQDSDEAKDSMLSDSDPCKVQYLELSFDLQNPKPQTFEHISTFLGISGLVILEALSLSEVFVGGISDRDGEEEAVAAHLMGYGW